MASAAWCTPELRCRCHLQQRLQSTKVVVRATIDTEGTVDSVISLPLFPLPSVLHPAQMGQLVGKHVCLAICPGLQPPYFAVHIPYSCQMHGLLVKQCRSLVPQAAI